MTQLVFIVCAIIIIFIVVYRMDTGENAYKYVSQQISYAYEQYAPYSFKVIREKCKEMGLEYTKKQYFVQIVVFTAVSFIIAYLYFYNIVVAVFYVVLVDSFIPYLAYLRCKRLYSEFLFEQVQVYTTNTIMEFATTQSFVKSLEGVYDSGVLEDPIKSDVKMMIDLAYTNGTIEQSLEYMNDRYNYYIVRNMHQLFLQINNEGSKDAGESLENMSQDIDMLVENVYRDRMDRQAFHKKFLQFGIVLYLMVMLVQFLLGVENYINMLNTWWVQVLLHGIVWLNTWFLLNGEKYYNEDVGAE